MGLQPLATSQWRTFPSGKPRPAALDPRLPSPFPIGLLPEAARVSCGQAAAMEGWPAALSFHQLIIFTNLQPHKKVHSGLNSPGQEPCGKAKGPEARPSRPEATSCLYLGPFLRLQCWPRSPVALRGKAALLT